MAEAQPIHADIPPHSKKKSSNVADNYKTLSGFEGYEEELGKAISIVLKMLGNHAGYAHELNDPLVKAHLMAIQFAKNSGSIDQYVAHDIKTMEPINLRMKNIVEKTGQKEVAMVGLFDRTACHYALALDTTSEPGKRTWKEPFGHVLKAAKKIGQFDLTVEEIHQNWTVPRLTGYAKAMGIELKISDIAEDGTITCELVD